MTELLGLAWDDRPDKWHDEAAMTDLLKFYGLKIEVLVSANEFKKAAVSPKFSFFVIDVLNLTRSPETYEGAELWRWLKEQPFLGARPVFMVSEGRNALNTVRDLFPGHSNVPYMLLKYPMDAAIVEIDSRLREHGYRTDDKRVALFHNAASSPQVDQLRKRFAEENFQVIGPGADLFRLRRACEVASRIILVRDRNQLRTAEDDHLLAMAGVIQSLPRGTERTLLIAPSGDDCRGGILQGMRAIESTSPDEVLLELKKPIA